MSTEGDTLKKNGRANLYKEKGRSPLRKNYPLEGNGEAMKYCTSARVRNAELLN